MLKGRSNHSHEPFPISVSEPIGIIPNQPEKHFVIRLMKNGQKSIRPDPI